MSHKNELELNEVEILKKLTSIDEELNGLKYQLGLSNFLLIKTAVLALIEFVKNIEDLSKKHNVYFIPVTVSVEEEKLEQEKVYVPIHLENYSRSPAEKKNQLLSALPRMFILSYEQVRTSSNKDALAIFASKLDGNCIDARTRMAFDYAAALRSPPCFEEVINKCVSKIKENKIKETYYNYFIELSQSYWNMPYSKDKARTSICQQDGFFDFNSFELLATYFDLILPYENEDDFSKYLPQKSGNGENIPEFLNVNEKDIPRFLMFALFSSVKFKDIKQANEIFDCLINACKGYYGAYDYFVILENFLMLIDKMKNLDGNQEHFHGNVSRLQALLAESINKVLNRWLPPFWSWYRLEWWSTFEIQWLAKIFLNENLVQYIINNNSDDIKNIKNSTKLDSLIKYVFKHKDFSTAIELLKVFNRIKNHNDYTLLWNLVNENQNIPTSISYADLFKVCKLNFNNPHCASKVHQYLTVLLQQEENLDIAVSAFKLCLKLSKDKTRQDFHLSHFTNNSMSLSHQYLDKLNRFVGELPKLKLDRENDERLCDRLNNALVQTFISKFNWEDDLPKFKNFIFSLVQKEKFVKRIRQLAATIDRSKVISLMTIMRELAQENKKDIQLYREITDFLETLFLKLNNDYRQRFQRYRQDVQAEIKIFRRKSKFFSKNGFHEARNCANQLIADFNVIQKEFFEDKIISGEEFHEKSAAIIKAARPVLEKHRGWGRVLDWLLFVLTAGLGNLIFHGLRNYQTTPKSHYSVSFNSLFFRKTDSDKRLDKLTHLINENRQQFKI